MKPDFETIVIKLAHALCKVDEDPLLPRSYEEMAAEADLLRQEMVKDAVLISG